MKKLAILLSALLAASSASALPVEEDPCTVEKVLVTKKQSRKPAKKSEIAAWIIVRSGGPDNPDAPRCLDETPIFDLPEPELVSWEPQALLPTVPEYDGGFRVKYACMEAFCIPTEGDNDADATTHEPTAKPGVTVVDPRGENRKPQDPAVVAQYVDRFKRAADNPDDMAAAADVFAIHNEVSSNHDLYIAIGDALGSKYKNAIHKFVAMAKKRAA